MSTAGNFPVDKAGKSPESQHNHRLDQEPVDYAYLEEHLDELDLSPTHYETMEEKHRRQGAEMWRFKKFVCALDEEQQRLSDRERFRLFLKQEGLRDREQRRRYLLFLWHDRHDLAEMNQV